MSLKEVLGAVKDIASNQAWLVKFALKNWLEAVDQLPQPFSNPQTEATMQAAQKACRQAPPDWEAPTSLPWLQQYIPDITTAIANQLDKQYHIIVQRLEVLQNLRTSLHQSPAKEGHHDTYTIDQSLHLSQKPAVQEQQQASSNSKLTALTAAEGKACALLQCAAEAYRELGAVTVLLSTVWQLEGCAAASQQGHMSRRQQKSQVQASMYDLCGEIKSVMDRTYKVYDVWKQFAQLTTQPERPPLTYVSTMTWARSEYLLTGTAAVWLSAAVRMPNWSQQLQQVSHVMFSCLADLPALLQRVIIYNLQPQKLIGDLMCLALSRKHLRANLLLCSEPHVVGDLLNAYKVTAQRMKELRLPQAVQQELLSWMQQATAKEAGNSGTAAAVCNTDTAAKGSDIDAAIADLVCTDAGAVDKMGTGTQHKGTGGEASSGIHCAPLAVDAASSSSHPGSVTSSHHTCTDPGRHAQGSGACSSAANGDTSTAAGVCVGSSVDDNRGAGASAGAISGLDDMQELLRMMYGLVNITKDAAQKQGMGGS